MQPLNKAVQQFQLLLRHYTGSLTYCIIFCLENKINFTHWAHCNIVEVYENGTHYPRSSMSQRRHLSICCLFVEGLCLTERILETWKMQILELLKSKKCNRETGMQRLALKRKYEYSHLSLYQVFFCNFSTWPHTERGCPCIHCTDMFVHKIKIKRLTSKVTEWTSLPGTLQCLARC